MPRTRKLTGVITLSGDGFDVVSYLGRCDEFSSAEEFLRKVMKDYDWWPEENEDFTEPLLQKRIKEVRQCYARVSMDGTMEESCDWVMMEYKTSGKGRFQVWWWDT